LITLIGIFVAGLLVGFTGFGFNLLAVPFLALLIPTKDAVIVALFVGAAVSVCLSMLLRQHVHVRVLAGLLAASLPGLAIGAVVFAHVSSDILRLIIGILTLVFSVFLIRREPTYVPATPRPVLGIGAGLLSGTLTVTTGMGGPPIVAYLMVGLGNVAGVRATLVLYTGLVSIAALAILAVTGDIGREQTVQAARLVPIGLAGLGLGVLLFRRVPHWYAKVVAITLVFVALNGILLTFL